MFVGLSAGFINTVAAGGSLISLPIMIFLGLSPNVANGTNRIAIFSQNIAAVRGFASLGVTTKPYIYYFGPIAFVGAALGTWAATEIEGELFNKVLAIVMLFASATIIFNPFKKKEVLQEVFSGTRKWLAMVAFFFVGLYGGFIQAGVGFVMIAAATMICQISLVKANAIKVTVALIYTTISIAIFAYNGQINWEAGVALAGGQFFGGWLGSHWSVKKGDEWIRRIMFVMIIFMAMKLLGVFEWVSKLFAG